MGKENSREEEKFNLLVRVGVGVRGGRGEYEKEQMNKWGNRKVEVRKR